MLFFNFFFLIFGNFWEFFGAGIFGNFWGFLGTGTKNIFIFFVPVPKNYFLT